MKKLIKKSLDRRNALIQTYGREWHSGNDWSYSHQITKGTCTFDVYTCTLQDWDFWNSCDIGDPDEERLVACGGGRVYR